MDYLITPALGVVSDNPNLWPESYSKYYLLTGHRLSMGFAGSAVISRAAQWWYE
jgi:hypothetical protein